MIRVLIVDDHAVVREGLRAFLELQEGIEVVAEAADGRQALAQAELQKPDVVLMDLVMPRLDGLEAMRQLRQRLPDIRVVALTSFLDDERLLPAIQAGAAGYLLKDAEPDELLRAIRAAARGEAPLAPKAALALITERSRAPDTQPLTEREREVLRLVGEGLPNKLIARRLAISEKTVKGHLTSIFQRIGVSDRTQAALWARSHAP